MKFLLFVCVAVLCLGNVLAFFIVPPGTGLSPTDFIQTLAAAEAAKFALKFGGLAPLAAAGK
ncbi:hypothetical protein HA402_012930 [Bradysia odoriphaga]|nr:hypothetical protein HA402_012930 [Bradysia odoriphaga]